MAAAKKKWEDVLRELIRIRNENPGFYQESEFDFDRHPSWEDLFCRINLRDMCVEEEWYYLLSWLHPGIFDVWKCQLQGYAFVRSGL